MQKDTGAETTAQAGCALDVVDDGREGGGLHEGAGCACAAQ
jgi:hypothetical protein